jgi:hypothetical protein
MIYSYSHPKHWSNVQPWNPPWLAPGRLEPFGSVLAEALKQLPDLVESLKVPMKSITTIKPDRAPPQILRDTCEGIHPPFVPYLRKVLKS